MPPPARTTNPFYTATSEELRSTKFLARLHRYLAMNINSEVTDDERDLLTIVGYAERALDVGDEPIHLFRWFMGGFRQNVGLITIAQEQRARRRLADYRKHEFYSR